MCCLPADERALVLGAKRLGFVFHTRLPDRVTITAVCMHRAVRSKSVEHRWSFLCWHNSQFIVMNSAPFSFFGALLLVTMSLVFS